MASFAQDRGNGYDSPMRYVLAVIAAVLCLAGCGSDRPRHAVVAGLPDHVRSIDVTAKLDKTLVIDASFDLTAQGARAYENQTVLIACERTHRQSGGRASDGDEVKLGADAQVRLRVGDKAFGRAFWKEGGRCTLLIEGQAPSTLLFAPTQ